MKKRHRPNVAAILRSMDGLVLIGQRSDYPESWQFPQGGVDAGESAKDAVRREVREETGFGADDFVITARKGPYVYDFPDGKTRRGFHGQSQEYFLCDLRRPGCPVPDAAATCGEFASFRWVAPAEFPLGLVPPMKAGVYREVLRDFFGMRIADG